MASRKKQEDKHLKILRELVSQQNNKKCFDCGQRGPTYVNMTVGVFVCTSCSGLLRGLNPPHRIKSISMATFSATEIEFLQNHGNEVCRSTWLALWDSSHPPEPESREEQKVKDFLIKKYERKMWYSSQPKQKAVPASVPEAKPLKQLLGENAPEVQATFQTQTVQAERQRTQPVAQPVAQPQQSPKTRFDLLADLGGDPFGSSESQQNHSQGFASFGGQNQQQDIFAQTQNQSPFGDNLNFPNQQPTAQPPFGGQATPFAAQPQQPPSAFGSFSQSSAFGQSQTSSIPTQSSLLSASDPFGAITPPASSSMSFDAFGQSSSNAQPANVASNGSFNFFDANAQSSTVSSFNQSAPPPGLTGRELDRYKALSELDDVFRGSNTQSVFSSSTSNSNAMERTANQQPNPFMSPASGTSGIAMFQQQQQKAPNPFQGGPNPHNQASNWGGMAVSQAQMGPSGAQQRNPQQFSQASFGSNQSQFGVSQAGFASGNQAGFGMNQGGFGNNQATMGTQMAFGHQARFPSDKSGFGPSQGQQAIPQQGFPQGAGGQQQMFNAQPQAFNGQQQAFSAQPNMGGQQFMGAQQGFGGHQMQGQMSGQMPGQMQGQTMPGQMQGQTMPGQMQGQMNTQMQGQMNTQMQGQMNPRMQGQMPGGFGNQQHQQQPQQQQQFGTWGQSSSKGVGTFGMGGLQAGMVQKSTNPFM